MCGCAGEVAIIGCSTALPSPPPLADGWLGRRQLQAIGDALTAQADRFRILLIHHPPPPQSLDLLRALRDRGRCVACLPRWAVSWCCTGTSIATSARRYRGPGETSR